jgi:hypothetical protein
MVGLTGFEPTAFTRKQRVSVGRASGSAARIAFSIFLLLYV